MSQWSRVWAHSRRVLQAGGGAADYFLTNQAELIDHEYCAIWHFILNFFLCSNAAWATWKRPYALVWHTLNTYRREPLLMEISADCFQ